MPYWDDRLGDFGLPGDDRIYGIGGDTQPLSESEFSGSIGPSGSSIIFSNTEISYSTGSAFSRFGYNTTYSKSYEAGLRFTNIALSSFSIVEAANIRFKAASTQIGPIHYTIQAENIGDSSTFSTLSNYDNRDRTIGVSGSFISMVSGSWYSTTDISGLIQRVLVQQPSWTTGNALAFFITPTDSTGQRFVDIHNYDFGDGSASAVLDLHSIDNIITITSDGHIYDTDTVTINSDGHIYDTDTTTINSDGHISDIDTVTINSDAFITHEITSDSHIWDTDTTTILSDGYIDAVDTATIVSNAHIWDSDQVDITSNALIVDRITVTIGSDAFITVEFNSDAHIYDTDTVTLISDSHIWDTDTTTITSDSYIWDNFSTTIVSNGHIWDNFSTTIVSNGHITANETTTIDSNAFILLVDVSTITSNAHIWDTGTTTIVSNGHITANETTTITSDAKLSGLTTVISNAHIWATETTTILSDGLIYDSNLTIIFSDAEITKETILSSATITGIDQAYEIPAKIHPYMKDEIRATSIHNPNGPRIDSTHIYS